MDNIPKINRQDVIAFSVSFHRPGDKKEADSSEVTTSADKDMILINKKLFDADEYDAVRKFDSSLYKWLKDSSVPLLGRKNIRLIAKNRIDIIDQKLKSSVKQRNELVEKFISAYPILIENARQRLNSQFNQLDYLSPSRIRDKFFIDWYYLDLGIPDTLPESLRKEAVEKMEKTWAEAAESIRDGLRVGFAQLVQHLIVRLQPGEDGKKKKFHESSIKNILEFIDALEGRNLTNDQALLEVTVQAKNIISNASADDIRESEDIRNNLISQMSKVKDQCDNLISSVKKRKFNLEE